MDVSLDRKWSLAVRKRFGGICPHCGRRPETGQGAHIIGRSNHKTRYVVENGVWACHEFHRMLEQGEEHKKKFIEFYVLKGLYDKIIKVASGENEPEEFGFTKLEKDSEI